MAQVEEAFLYPNRSTELPWRFRVVEEGGKGRLIRTRAEEERFRAEPHRIVALTREFPTLRGEPVVFARPDRTREALARSLRAEGVRTLAETDDNYFANKNLNIFARENENWERDAHAHACAMASMHAIVFSTAWLRDAYLKEFTARFKVKGLPKKAWLPEAFVCRNHMPSWAWPEPAERDSVGTLGFMGSPSHVHDVSSLAYASFHAAKQFGWRTSFVGYNPADPDPDVPREIEVDGKMIPTRSEKSLAMSDTWAKVVDHHQRWIDPAEFKRGGLPFDIGLAPLQSNLFCFGKSDIKAIEYAVSGALPVVSRHQVFTRAGWVHRENCLMGSSQEDLAEQVVAAIRDPKMRSELVANARAMIRETRNEETMRDEWMAALG